MKILIDCDVLLDVALRRKPFFETSGAVLDWAERNPGKACVAWHSIANLHYLCEGSTTEFIEDLSRFVDIPPTGSNALGFALSLEMKDFEDAMQVAAADLHEAQSIVTRNLKHYTESPIQALSPKRLLSVLKS